MKAAVAFLLVAASTSAGAGLDQSRTAWRYRRTVSLASPEGFAELALPPELRARARPDLRDVRLLAADGTEVPYVVDRVVDREASRTWTGTLTDTSQEPVGPAGEGEATSRWTVDLGALREIDQIALDVSEQDFAKHVRVEGSADGRSWTTLAADAPVFDRAWQGRVRHTRIALGPGAAVRYLRLATRDHRRSPPITLVGVNAVWTRRAPGETWSRPAAAVLEERANGTSRYRIEAPDGLPFEDVRVTADDAAFSRRIVLREGRGATGRVLADGWVYRVKLPEEALAGEQLSLSLATPPQGGVLLLEVHDGDSPPLRSLRLDVSGAATRLLFAGSGAPVVLYYGNEVTRAPLYDLGALHGRIMASGRRATAALGGEEANPAYQKPAPLPVGPLRGAQVDASLWRAERPLQLGDGTDLYVVTLAPEDLAFLRSDLGDLRLVDDAGRQVPYILEPSAVEGRVALVAEKMRARDRRTRYRLGAPALPARSALPLEGLVLPFEEPFFDRPARVRLGGDKARGRVLWSGRIERRPSVGPSVPEPIRLGWSAEPVRDVEIEVDDGDNVPLVLASAEGLVRVPRLTFQAGSGSYRLLLGNREASAPQYDLASLRREVLAWSAVVATPGAARANPAFRRFAGELLADGPPTLLLWGTLLATVAVLLWLTVRVLRQPPAEPPPSDAEGGSA